MLREVYRDAPMAKSIKIAEIFNCVVDGQWKLKSIIKLSLDAGNDPEKQKEVEREFERWVSQDR